MPSIEAGTKLGPYEIVAPLGSGGMGEVYRARDTRLGRDVAIKMVSKVLAQDGDRLRRFELEARTVAGLNHPNILGIHDIGTYHEAPYLVSELLEGETLREKLVGGALPVRRAVEYALGVARGLAAAHEKGIVHRDLKPENIFITRDGRVKILDFGLAKLAKAGPDGDVTVTSSSPHTLTQPGMVVGTVGYMSPEQVRGEATDARSDIFSFGAVLYEMLTGKRAFKRDTTAETMTAILREEPPELTETGWQGPLGLQRILGRCLEKNVERRFQSASDLAFAIESLSGTGTTPSVVALPAATKRNAWWPWAAGAAALALVAGGAWYAGKLAGVKAPPKYTRLTYQQGYVSGARFAKGGEMVVYSGQWGEEPLRLYTVRVEFPQSSKLELPPGMLLALSPTEELELGMEPQYYANFMDGTMAQAGLAGIAPREQLNDVIAADYGPAGKRLAVARQTNQRVQLEYPMGKVIYATSGYVDYVRVSPDGKLVAFADHPVYDDDRGWVSVVDEQGNKKQLTGEYATLQGLAWSRSGKEVWYSACASATDRHLYAVTLSGKQREILSTPRGTRVMDIASDGRVLVSAEDLRSEIIGIDPVTHKERRGLEWFNGSGLGDITPDGTAIVYYEWGGPAGELYLTVYRKLDGSAPKELGEGGSPVFSPDGKTAAAPLFTRPPQIVLQPIGAGESRRLSLGDIASLTHVAWFPDGKHVLFLGSVQGMALRTYKVSTDDGRTEAVGPQDFLGEAVASDGRRIVGRSGGKIVIFDTASQKMEAVPGVTAADWIDRWTQDGEGVIAVASTPWEAEISRVDLKTGKRSLLQKIALENRAGVSLNLRAIYAERSNTYVYNTRRVLSSLYVVDGLE